VLNGLYVADSSGSKRTTSGNLLSQSNRVIWRRAINRRTVKVLLLNPEDTPYSGEWQEHLWDLIVDLGWAGPDCHRRWGQQLRTQVISLYDFQEPIEVFRKVNEIIDVGRNQLLDSQGIDWWELIAAVQYEKLQFLCLLNRLKEYLGTSADLTASRPPTNLFEQVWDRRIPCFHSRPSRRMNWEGRAGRVWNLTPAQIVEVAFDKWDADYKLRRYANLQLRLRNNDPLVLLPSPYVNVSRVVLAYASLLPERKFLLVSTRHSGKWKSGHPNVLRTSLAAYARSSRRSRREAESLVKGWDELKRVLLTGLPELRWATQAGYFNDFAERLAAGVCARDAWWNLLRNEPIESVLCGDDLNIYTRIPLILAKQMGLRSIYCAHGALDATLLFKQRYADIYLAKGEMEADYMARICRVPQERIEIGAPNARANHGGRKEFSCASRSIVFFSQPYEVYKGRPEEAYREILPRLCNIARTHDCKVIVKLHPFESRRERKRLIERVLPPSKRSLIEISACRFASELFDKAWFGISVSSSVALECAQQGIPFFNCGWLEPKDTGYVQQFTKFGAGQLLTCPEEIDSIPKLIRETNLRDPSSLLCETINSKSLERFMFGDLPSEVQKAVPTFASKVAGRLLRRVFYPSLSKAGYLFTRANRFQSLAVITYHGVLPSSYQEEDRFIDGGMVRTDAFRRQLRWLKSHYCVIDPEACHRWLMGRGDLPSRAVLLTCDDGLLSTATEMLPVLHEEQVKCLFFVTGSSLCEHPVRPWYLQLYLLLLCAPRGRTVVQVDSLRLHFNLGSRQERCAVWWRLVKELSKYPADKRQMIVNQFLDVLRLPREWDLSYRQEPSLRERYTTLSRSNLQQLVDAGMAIGNHTLSHPLLSQSSDEVSWKEIAGTQAELQSVIGTPVWALAYPFGDRGSITPREISLAEQAGYDCAFLNFGGCVHRQSLKQRFALPRLHISARMGIAEIEALVSGLDWSLREQFARYRFAAAS